MSSGNPGAGGAEPPQDSAPPPTLYDRLLPLIWQSAADAMAVSDPQGTVIAANPAYYGLYGYAHDQVVGQNFAIIFPEAQRATANAMYRQVFEAGYDPTADTVESTIERADGTQRVVESRYAFLMEGEVRIAMLSTIRDITERKRLEAAAQAAHAAAEEAITLRDAFLSIAAHELRGPLTAMLGNVQLLERRAVRGLAEPAKDLEGLGIVSDQIRHMTRLLNGLLDVSRIELGQLSLTLAPLDVVTLVLQLLDELQSSHREHQLRVEVPELALLIEGDEVRLQQALRNLIQNAVKYTPAGGAITVSVAQREGQVCIEIADEGIGISQEELPKLFQRFFRAQNARSQNIPGAGIGLYVVKEIVVLHSGRIEVQSAEGQGSRFTIWLPLIRG